MSSIEQQLNKITNKDEFIKWLVNMYFVQSWKIDDETGYKEVAAIERQYVKAKADEIIRGEK